MNPEDQTITVLRLKGDTYVEHGVFRPGETVTSAFLEGFSLAASDVLDAR